MLQTTELTIPQKYSNPKTSLRVCRSFPLFLYLKKSDFFPKFKKKCQMIFKYDKKSTCLILSDSLEVLYVALGIYGQKFQKTWIKNNSGFGVVRYPASFWHCKSI